MIGVVAALDDLDVVTEFFELFKTPWEPYVQGRDYDVVLSSSAGVEDIDARVILAYGSARQENDSRHLDVYERPDGVELTWAQERIPVYGRVGLFAPDAGTSLLTMDGRPVDHRRCNGSQVVWRIGYDLFSEVRFLLEFGQPAERALTPTLEWHIELLRHLLRESRTSFVEIPPRPAGFDYTCCLTHDLDFYGIRRHAFDRTLAGFVARASIVTFLEWARGRRPVSDVVRSWYAVATLPLVLLRVLRDFWRPIDDYERVERDLPATYFVIPFKDKPGTGPDGTFTRARAVSYRASDVEEDLRAAVSRGREVAVHGIDAWRNADAGRAERGELVTVTGRSCAGVRMHWLYYDNDSPRRLEEAGFDYDSTWGYNDAVGFRSGTSQVFRFLGTQSLMELPLTIMDSALFFRGRLNLTHDEGLDRCSTIVRCARRFGGTVVINWHDRSLAPERLWGRSYRALLEIVSGDRAWFATSSAAVDWFKWRRSITFQAEGGKCRAIVAPPRSEGLPDASVLLYRQGQASVEAQGPTIGSHGLSVEL